MNTIKTMPFFREHGAFNGWACPIDEEGGAYPFVIDTPNMAMYKNIIMPQIVNFQITAFAHKVEAYADDQEFSSAQNNLLRNNGICLKNVVHYDLTV